MRWREVQVDVTFHGHDHVYERTCPVYNGTCQSPLADGSLGGPVHVVIGNAGFSLSYLPNPYIPPYWVVRPGPRLIDFFIAFCIPLQAVEGPC